MPSLPKVDNRLIHIFLSVVLIRDFLAHTRTCYIGAKHRPKVDAGQDQNNAHRLFMVYEECVGINGQRCSNHGLQFFMQLTEKQLVHAVAQVVQLEPFPYHSEALLDWCVNYLLPRHDLLPGHLIPAARAPPSQPTSMAATVVAPRPRGLTRPSTPRDRRYRGCVTNLMPGLSAGGNNPGPLRHPSSTRASASVAAPVTSFAKVYAYTKDGRHPVVIDVDANHQGTMTYVNLRHPDILQAFGLKARARNLPDKIQVYDTYGGKWYHPATVALWLRLNPHEFLILKAPTITSTPGLEDYAKANLAKPARGGADTLRGFLALSRTPDDCRLPFSPVPPLTVMFADVPENAIAQSSAATYPTTARGRAPATPFSRSPRPSGSRPPALDRTHRSKRQKLNNGSAGAPTREIIELSSDEEEAPPVSTQHTPTRSQSPLPTSRPTNRPRKRLLQAPDTLVTVSSAAKKPKATQKTKATLQKEVIVISDDERPTIVPTSTAREVIIISDEEEPVIRGSVAQSTSAGGSNLARARADPTALRDELVPSRFPSLTPCTSFRVTRTRAKGKGKMRAVEDEDDSGADSDKTLC